MAQRPDTLLPAPLPTFFCPLPVSSPTTDEAVVPIDSHVPFYHETSITMLKPVGQLSHIDESLHADNLCEPQGFGKLLLEVMRAKDTMEKTDVTNDAPRQMNGETADQPKGQSLQRA